MITTTEPVTQSRWSVLTPGRVGALVGAVCGVVILGPALRRGYTWSYDMVFVPRMPLSSHTLGTDGSVPRAVPTDAVVSLLSAIVPADLLQAALLLLIFVVAGAGCGRLCRTLPGAVTASVAVCWNPYVTERLVIGHWSFLLGFATLPWICAAARSWAGGDRRAAWSLFAWLSAASIAGSTSAVIAAVMALTTLVISAPSADVAQRVRGVSTKVAATLLILAVLNAAWIVPSIDRPGGVPADPSGVPAFAARADTPWGVFPSLLTLGGIWHEPSWPGSRSSALTVGVALVVVLAVAVLAVRFRLLRELAPLMAAGVVGLLVASLAVLPGGSSIATTLVTEVPGAGIIRDSQKFVALLAVLLAVAAGRVVDCILVAYRDDRRHAPTPLAWVAALALTLAPVATLPDAPSSAGGRLGPQTISPDILRARAYLESAAPGGAAIFPWTLYRRFAWNDDRVSLDPWNRLLSRPVIVDDDLTLSGTTVEGEDSLARAIGRAVADGDADLTSVLGRTGVRWAVVLDDQPDSADATSRLADAPATRFGEVTVYDLGDSSRPVRPDDPPWPIIISLTAAAALVMARAGSELHRRRRSRTPMG